MHYICAKEPLVLNFEAPFVCLCMCPLVEQDNHVKMCHVLHVYKWVLCVKTWTRQKLWFIGMSLAGFEGRPRTTTCISTKTKLAYSNVVSNQFLMQINGWEYRCFDFIPSTSNNSQASHGGQQDVLCRLINITSMNLFLVLLGHR
jgi:hypothetical protein